MKLVTFEKFILRCLDQDKWQTLFRLGSAGEVEQTDTLYQLLRNQAEKETIYMISLEGIDYMSAISTHALIKASMRIFMERKKPVIFIQASGEVLVGLKQVSNLLAEDIKLWVIDTKGQEEVLGHIPDRLREILDLAKQKQYLSASDIPNLRGEVSNKKSINNASVYLQDMFNMGLLLRKKVTGSSRNIESRGWTYTYYLPYSELNIFHNYKQINMVVI
ncbi:MAG TPA: hypothetical protein V6D25_31095 [Leptolyngbyaceae cyanobacterium]